MAFFSKPIAVANRRYIADMTVLPLCDCPESVTESVVRCYVTAQKDGIIIKALGFKDEELVEYARFMAKEARKYPWNSIAIDANGDCQGMFFTLPKVQDVDYSQLPQTAQDHWTGVFLAVQTVLEKHVADGSYEVGTLDGVLCGVIGCANPDLQGKGVHQLCCSLAMDLAYAHGRRLFWTFTANPFAIQSVGKSQPHIQLATRLAKQVFQLPIWISNNFVIPVLRVLRMFPKGSTCFFVSKEEVPIFKLITANVLALMGPVAKPKNASEKATDAKPDKMSTSHSGSNEASSVRKMNGLKEPLASTI